MYRCRKCLAPRKTKRCKKCGRKTFTPAKGWEELKLPPIDKIRKLAKEVGYAIGVHGTLERDLDLIAAPWTSDAVSNFELVAHISRGLDGTVVDVASHKPLGRFAVNIKMKGWFKMIDLSVCPRKF